MELHKESTHWEVRWSTYKPGNDSEQKERFENEPSAHIRAMQLALDPPGDTRLKEGFEVVEVETHIRTLRTYTKDIAVKELTVARPGLQVPAQEIEEAPLEDPIPKEPVRHYDTSPDLDDEILY